MKKVKISDRCEPYMYNSQNDLTTFNIGDVVDVVFMDKVKVKKDYKGKTIRFFINNILDYHWSSNERRLALIPLDKKDKFSDKDVLIIDHSYRFDCLMIDLYPENRRPYAGWRGKEVEITLIDKIEIPKPDFTYNENLNLKVGDIYVHIEEYKFLSNIWGGEGREILEMIKDELGNPKLQINGFVANEIPKNIIKEGPNFFRDYLSISVKFKGKNNSIYAPYLVEFLDEFNKRREILMELALDFISKNKGNWYKDGLFVFWDYAVNESNEILLEKCVSKRKDRSLILENMIERSKYKLKRGW
jgi:hypothetical protein